VTQHGLDLRHARSVELADQGQRLPLAMRASRAADAMNVVFSMHGNVEVHDEVDVVDVDRAQRRRGEHVEHAIAVQ
jgi:hypothetical protein